MSPAQNYSMKFFIDLYLLRKTIWLLTQPLLYPLTEIHSQKSIQIYNLPLTTYPSDSAHCT